MSRRSSISLEDGADEWPCDEGSFRISARGMYFHSRCRFSLGTQLAVTFSFFSAETETDGASDGGMKRASVEGVVVSCEECAPRLYHVALLFLDLPDEMRSLLCAGGVPAGDEPSLEKNNNPPRASSGARW